MGRTALLFAVMAALAGCTPPPALIGAGAPDVTSAAYPTLAPVDEILASAPPLPQTDPAAPVEARAAALRARAARLRALTP
jgi:hypothetical protein